MPTALPSAQYVGEKVFKGDPSSLSAYNTILSLEMSLLLQSNPHETSLIYARVIGYLLIHAPNYTARAYVRREVHSCGAKKDPNTALLDLGKMYIQYFIRRFKNPKNRTPALSRHLSRPSFDSLKGITESTLVEAPQNHRDARQNALVRDRFRCVITGAIDLDSIWSNKELRNEVNAQVRAGKRPKVECIEVARILSDSGTSKGSEKLNYAASPWAILSVFGYDHILDVLEEQNIYRLENILALSHTAHECFDDLIIWFEKTNTENKYKVGTTDEALIFGALEWPQFVDFTTTNSDLALPSAEYLSLHATAAKVAHLSGATEYLDKIYETEEELDVLSPDGSSAEILENALYSLTVPCVKAY